LRIYFCFNYSMELYGYMKEEYEPLAEDLKTYSDGLIQALKTGRHHDGLEYVGKMTQHIAKIREYLEVKIIAKQVT